MSGNWLATRTAAGPLMRIPGDYRYLEDVVRIGYPILNAKTYLKRHLGNRISYRLVEALRGETLGVVRQIEVQPQDGGPVVQVRAVRTLPDGSPASYFAPSDLVEVNATITWDGDGGVPALRPHDDIVLHVPVRTYLRFLPGIYQGAVPTQRRDIARASERSARQWGRRDVAEDSSVQVHHADQFRRFMLLFQHLMTTVLDKIDAIPAITDPMLADPKFLPWLASWVNFALDESLPLHEQRELVRRSIRLHRTRGTRAGVEEMIRVLTRAKVDVAECQKPRGCVLGKMTLAGGRTISDRFERAEPPAHFMVLPQRQKTTFFALSLEEHGAFKKRFGADAKRVLRRISQIVTNERPAHVTFTIEFKERI